MINFILISGLVAIVLWVIVDFNKKPKRSMRTLVASKNTPFDDLENYYPQAFANVISELDGPQAIQQRMHAGQEEFLQLLGDPRKAGHWVAQKLDGLDWDWPRWHAYVKTSGYNNHTLPALREEAAAMTQADALNLMTMPQLKSLLREHGSTVPVSKATKANVLAAMQSLPSIALDEATQEQVRQWLSNKAADCRQKMGARMASRISHIAMERRQLQQRNATDLLALRPNWKFICSDPQSAPNSCKKFNGKVLPAQQAIGTFPSLPCDLLDCRCRIETCRK